MKLIIDIPEEDYKNVSRIVDMGLGTNVDEAIKNGTPLDDVKAELEHMACRQYEHRLMLDRQETLEILDKYIGKAESEDKE